MRSELSSAGTEIGIEQYSVVARGERRLGTRLSAGAAVGSILGGTLRPPGGEELGLGAGWSVGVNASLLAVAERELWPFVLASLSLAYSVTHTEAGMATGEARFVGRDMRLGVAMGKTFGPARPYVAGRMFGGGFRWEGPSPAATGGDSHLYQIGAGAALERPLHLDFVLEIMPLGERSLTAGFGASFG
jgi:hypothetical protein